MIDDSAKDYLHGWTGVSAGCEIQINPMACEIRRSDIEPAAQTADHSVVSNCG